MRASALRKIRMAEIRQLPIRWSTIARTEEASVAVDMPEVSARGLVMVRRSETVSIRERLLPMDPPVEFSKAEKAVRSRIL